jgi:hypothetical protein
LVFELSFDLQHSIDAVIARRPLSFDPGPRFYLVKQAPGVSNPIYEVSPRIAKAARLCNGVLTVGQIAEKLTGEIPEIREEWRALYSLGLIEKARDEGILAIFRTSCLAVSSHGAGDDACEYNSMSASASEQNQSLIQARYASSRE